MGDTLAGSDPTRSHREDGARMHAVLTRSHAGGRNAGTPERNTSVCSRPDGSVPHTTNS